MLTLRRFPEVRRSARIAAKNAEKPAEKPLPPVLLQLKSMMDEFDKCDKQNTTERIYRISNIFEFMHDDRLKNTYAKQTKFREEVKNKIKEIDLDITCRIIPYWLAMKYHEASKNLREYIQEIEKTL
jgi:hypothetical protein